MAFYAVDIFLFPIEEIVKANRVAAVLFLFPPPFVDLAILPQFFLGDFNPVGGMFVNQM